MADTPALRRLSLLSSLLVVVALALGACGDDDPDAAPDDPPTTTTTATTTGATEPTPGDAGDAEAFCAEMARLDVETPESYVGSDEHVADVEALIEVAPDAVRPAVERYRDFLASGQVTDDPDTKQADGWPADVQADIAEIQDFRTSAC